MVAPHADELQRATRRHAARAESLQVETTDLSGASAEEKGPPRGIPGREVAEIRNADEAGHRAGDSLFKSCAGRELPPTHLKCQRDTRLELNREQCGIWSSE